MEERQPHDSQNQIIEPSDFWPTIVSNFGAEVTR